MSPAMSLSNVVSTPASVRQHLQVDEVSHCRPTVGTVLTVTTQSGLLHMTGTVCVVVHHLYIYCVLHNVVNIFLIHDTSSAQRN